MKRPLAVALVTILLGGTIFAHFQHIPVLEGIYWAMTTAATVGYGDVSPHDRGGRVIAVVVMLVAIPSLASAYAHFSARRLKAMAHASQLQIAKDAAAARRIMADLYHHHTGQRHPLHPGDEDDS